MPVDTSMYGNIQQVNPMQTMGQMVGISNAIQQNQALRNQNVQSGIDAQEMQNLQPVLRDTAAYTDERGNIDFNKFVPMIMQTAPKNGAAIVQQMAGAQQQRSAAQNAISTQSAAGLQRASNAIFGIDPATVTPEQLDQTAAAINKNFTDPQAQYATTQLFENAKKVVQGTKPGDPMRDTNLKHLAMMYQPIEAQQGINTPTMVQMSNNQQTWMQNAKPGVAGVPQFGVVPNSAVQQQRGVEAPTVDASGTPGVVGPQSGGSNPAGANQKPGFQPTGLPAGTVGNIEANFATMNKHFETLQDASQGAQAIQALRGNIQQLATKAITGTESDRLSYANGLLSQFGNEHASDAKEATDLLKKQLAKINVTAPATTDAMRTLVDASNPNVHMEPKAIKEATDQLASQVEANVAIRNHLAGYKYANNGQGNAVSYQAERQNLEKIADPRIWQYQSLTPGSPEAKAFVANLPAADRDPSNAKGMAYKMQQLQKIGVIQ